MAGDEEDETSINTDETETLQRELDRINEANRILREQIEHMRLQLRFRILVFGPDPPLVYFFYRAFHR